MPADWATALSAVLASPQMDILRAFLRDRKNEGAQTCPPPHEWFSAFAATPLQKVKAIILAQEPWNAPGMATGMAYSVRRGSRMPPTLHNIHKEVCRDLRIPAPAHGSLEKWADSGVLLLNTVLTAETGTGNGTSVSHKGRGWEALTDAVLAAVLARPMPCALLLWGKDAHSKAAELTIDPARHLILESSHPAPYSVRNGFLGCSHFSKASDFIHSKAGEGIDWSLPL